MRYLVLIAVLAGAATACRDAAAPAGPSLASEASARTLVDLREARASLIAAGDALSDAVTDQGVVAGLGAALTANAIFESPRVNLVRGASAVTSFLSTNALAPSALSWHVIAADVSNDGTRGYTWADGSSTINFGTGATPRPSLFLIYWSRSGDDWQVQAFVFNSGGPQPVPLPAGFGTPDTKFRRNFPNTDPSEQAAAILGADAAFSAASVANGSGPAFEQYAAPNAIAIGAGTFVFGPAEIGEAFTGGPDDVVSWIPRFADAAASGDLGFSVGEATFVIEGAGTFYSKYLTIWQKQNTGEWRFVADEGNSRPAPTP